MTRNVLLALIVVLALGCSAEIDADPPSDASNRFGFQLFDQVVQGDSGKNVFISPASAAIALAMLYNGAEYRTREEMARTLELDTLSLETVNRAYASLLASLNAGDSDVELVVANSIWYRNTFEFRQIFLDRTEKYYGAEVAALDFTAPEAVDVINAWVKKETREKIGGIIDEIHPLDVMFLINAVYFKGIWTHQFEPGRTSDRDFHLLDGSVPQKPLMEQTGSFAYHDSDALQAIRLPYGSKRFSMIVVLPSPDAGLGGFLGDLSPENWTRLLASLEEREGTIALPKCKLEYDRLFNDALIELGMPSVFSGATAELTGLWEPEGPFFTNLYVSFVRQKTFLEVNEEGTEAAAVTGIGVTATSYNPDIPPPFRMVVDRPFFCAIVDDETGLILFLGAIVDPS